MGDVVMECGFVDAAAAVWFVVCLLKVTIMARSLTAKKARKKRTVSASKRRKSDPSPSERQWLSWKPMQFCSGNPLLPL